MEQGRGARIQRIGPGDTMQARWMGDTAVFTAPLFLDFPIGQTGRRYQAWENYDFFIQTRRGVRQPNQLSWARYGDAVHRRGRHRRRGHAGLRDRGPG